MLLVFARRLIFFPRFPFARATDFKMQRMKHRLVLLFESFDLLCLFSFIVSFSLHFTCSLKLTFLNAEREFSRVIHVIPALSCPMERQRGKYFVSPQFHSVSIVDTKLYVNNCTRWWKQSEGYLSISLTDGTLERYKMINKRRVMVVWCQLNYPRLKIIVILFWRRDFMLNTSVV